MAKCVEQTPSKAAAPKKATPAKTAAKAKPEVLLRNTRKAGVLGHRMARDVRCLMARKPTRQEHGWRHCSVIGEKEKAKMVATVQAQLHEDGKKRRYRPAPSREWPALFASLFRVEISARTARSWVAPKRKMYAAGLLRF